MMVDGLTCPEIPKSGLAKPTPFVGLLLQLRTSAGMSQKQFAAFIGISGAYQSDIEHGRRGPSVAYVNKIVSAFEMSPEDRRKWHRAAVMQLGWEISEEARPHETE